MKNSLFFLIVFVLFSLQTGQDKGLVSHKINNLFFTEPATSGNEYMPLGNGKAG